MFLSFLSFVIIIGLIFLAFFISLLFIELAVVFTLIADNYINKQNNKKEEYTNGK